MRITGETTVDSLYHSEDELTHYGVKGQKWGVRRYQNKDGSLTPAGKKRQNLSEDEARHWSEKSRRSKLSQAQTITELKKATAISRDPDFDENSQEFKEWLKLDKEIRDFSGDWNHSKGVSQGFTDAVNRHKNRVERVDQEYGIPQREASQKYHRALDDATVKNLPKTDQFFVRKFDRVIDDNAYEKARNKARNDPEIKRLEEDYHSKSSTYISERGKLYSTYHSDLCGAVLRDLGYKDSPEARELIRDTVIWD